MRVERIGGDRAEADGIAVRRGLGHGVHADIAARAGAVLDHHRLAQFLAHALAYRARHQVGGAAGSVGHDKADRPGRITVAGRGGGAEADGERGGACHGSEQRAAAGMCRVDWHGEKSPWAVIVAPAVTQAARGHCRG
ncbi:hypothetical protein D3C81_1702850 [compost metagenome]